MRINNHLLKNYLLEKKLIKNSDSVDFKEVGRGAFNINYLVEASGGEKFLFRFIIWSMRDHIGDMVKYESLALRNLEGLDISPKLILTDGTKSAFRYPLIVEEYIDGKTIKQGQGKFIEQVIEALPVVIKLYQNGETEGIIPQSEIISSGLLERKLECFEKYDSFLVKIINLNKNIIIEFTEKCNKLLNDKVFVHGDLNPENFIYSEDKKWYLVDWQSSFVGDASFDIATLLWDFYWNFFIGKLSFLFSALMLVAVTLPSFFVTASLIWVYKFFFSSSGKSGLIINIASYFFIL